MIWRSRVLLTIILALSAFAWRTPAQPAHSAGYDGLVALYNDVRAASNPRRADVAADYSAAAMEKQAAMLPDFRQRLTAIDAARWPIPERVDYLLVRAAIDNFDFQHRVLHPWSSDPGFYVDMVQPAAYPDLPVQGERLTTAKTRLDAVPKTLAQAKTNLTRGARELTKLAIYNLDHADGVGHGMPYRAVPPAGTHGWFVDFIERAKKQQPDLVPSAEKALAAVDDFHAWLKQRQGQMTAPSGVGRDNFNWYLKHVRFMRYTMEDSVKVGEREYERSMAFLALARNHNRALPEITVPASKEDYDKRLKDAQDAMREFIRSQDILTIPDYAAGPLHQNVPWIVREGGKRNFWEEIQFRDPRPDTAHATLPGHVFDGVVHQHDKRPIRGTFGDSGRTEGWGFYLEEAMLQLGFLDDRPRTKELFYIFQAARGVRNPAEAKLHTNEWTIDQAVKYMVDKVPYMDNDVARVDAEIYLKRPTYGLSYQMGKMEMLKLLGDRQHQLGNKFNLKAFHDQFLAAGTIPISLIRWEITGLDDEAKEFWGTPTAAVKKTTSSQN
jgi:Bacterial protein of unknown function (DUF885)